MSAIGAFAATRPANISPFSAPCEGAMFPPEEIAWLLIEADSLLAAKGRSTGWLADPHRSAPIFARLALDPRLLAHAEGELGGAVRLVATGLGHGADAPIERVAVDSLRLFVDLGGSPEAPIGRSCTEAPGRDIVFAVEFRLTLPGEEPSIATGPADLWPTAFVCAS